MTKCPLPVTIIGILLIATGALGLIAHITELQFQADFLLVSLVRALAIVSGIFLLRGANWARWLALAWIAFHVVVSFFHSPMEVLVHAVLCAAFAYFLFRPAAGRYFGSVRA